MRILNKARSAYVNWTFLEEIDINIDLNFRRMKVSKIKENRIYQAERLQYQQNYGPYRMGSFVNLDPQEMEREAFVMYPTKNTLGMFNLLREMDGIPPFEEAFQEDYARYASSNRYLRKFLQKIYKSNFSISAEGAEFLEAVGNEAEEHTIRCVEAVDAACNLYYILIGGRAPLECKSDELGNARSFDYHADLFTYTADEQAVVFHEQAFIELIFGMVQDYFQRQATLENLVEHTALFGVDGPFLTDELHISEVSSSLRIAMIIKTNLEWTPLVN